MFFSIVFQSFQYLFFPSGEEGVHSSFMFVELDSVFHRCEKCVAICREGRVSGLNFRSLVHQYLNEGKNFCLAEKINLEQHLSMFKSYI